MSSHLKPFRLRLMSSQGRDEIDCQGSNDSAYPETEWIKVEEWERERGQMFSVVLKWTSRLSLTFTETS